VLPSELLCYDEFRRLSNTPDLPFSLFWLYSLRLKLVVLLLFLDS